MKNTASRPTSILSDADLRRAAECGEVHITRSGKPVSFDEFRGCSIDLHLSTEYYRFKKPRLFRKPRVLDLASVNQDQFNSMLSHHNHEHGDGIEIAPGEVILGRTTEHLQLSSGLAGILTGRSSYARIGLSVEFSANLICPGHHNSVPLQICNHTPYVIILYPGTAICQLLFMPLSSPANLPYDKDPISKYHGRSGVILSQWYREMTPPQNPLATVKSRFDYAQFLNFTLITFTVLSVGQMAAMMIMDQATADSVKPVLFLPTVGVLLLSCVVRVIVFARENRRGRND